MTERKQQDPDYRRMDPETHSASVFLDASWLRRTVFPVRSFVLGSSSSFLARCVWSIRVEA